MWGIRETTARIVMSNNCWGHKQSEWGCLGGARGRRGRLPVGQGSRPPTGGGCCCCLPPVRAAARGRTGLSVCILFVGGCYVRAAAGGPPAAARSHESRKMPVLLQRRHRCRSRRGWLLPLQGPLTGAAAGRRGWPAAYCGACGGIACATAAGCCAMPAACGAMGMTTCGTRQSSSCMVPKSSSTSALKKGRQREGGGGCQGLGVVLCIAAAAPHGGCAGW